MTNDPLVRLDIRSHATLGFDIVVSKSFPMESFHCRVGCLGSCIFKKKHNINNSNRVLVQSERFGFRIPVAPVFLSCHFLECSFLHMQGKGVCVRDQCKLNS